jgi:hypothetical protein
MFGTVARVEVPPPLSQAHWPCLLLLRLQASYTTSFDKNSPVAGDQQSATREVLR